MATSSAATDFGTDAQSYYFQEGVGLSLDTDAMSCLSWILHDSGGTDQVVYSQLDGTGIGRIWLKLISSDVLNSFIGGSSVNGATTLSTGTWYHAGTTFPGGSSQTNTLYLNASVDNSGTVSGEAATGDLRIGALKNGTQEFGGLMAWALLYNRVLSASEINEVMWNPFSIPNGLIWAPDEQDTTVSSFTDHSPQQNGSADAVSGSLAVSNDGPPVFLLGGQ